MVAGRSSWHRRVRPTTWTSSTSACARGSSADLWPRSDRSTTELRHKILEKRVQERRQADPSFEIGRDVLGLLAERLSESGRELEGAVTRLHATWQYMRTPITMEVAEQMIRDLVHGMEPRRIKIDEIQKMVSRHYGVSKSDLLSERRHRSVVWPRQIGMYLSKQLTSRSLPEIGRRFGGRDHTTVLHAIRKIENELSGNARLQGRDRGVEKAARQLRRARAGTMRLHPADHGPGGRSVCGWWRRSRRRSRV